MIADIPRVKVSGVNYPIYALEYTMGGADSPSQIKIDFANDSGEYDAPILNTSSISKISVGDFFKFSGYPVSKTKSHSVTTGDSISVTYWDTSIILDKIFVGLHGIHGITKTNQVNVLNRVPVSVPIPSVSGTFSNIILLGTYSDPCEGIREDYIDPCDPCPSVDDLNSITSSNSGKKINCAVETQTRILDVTYTFQELLASLGKVGIKFFGQPFVNPNYYARFSGTAREVLKQWCQELGLTFYWDDGVVFVDLKSGIEINDTDFYTSCSLLSYSESESIESNTYNGNIFYFGAEGKIVEQDCSGQNVYRVALQPITLKDIFWSYSNDGSPSGQSTGLNQYISKYYTYKNSPVARYQDRDSIYGLHLACSAIQYSPYLRDLTILNEFYGVNSADDLENGYFPLLGIEKVIEVGDFVTEDSTNSSSQLGRVWFTEIDDKLREFLLNFKGRIVKVKYNKELHGKFLSFEKKLADEFIGRFWINFMNDKNYSFSVPDGDVKVFSAGAVPSLPFLDVIPESIRGQSVLLQKLLKQTKDKNAVEAGKEPEPEEVLRSSFILLDRKGMWEPTENSETVADFLARFEKFSPTFIDPFKSQSQSKTGNGLKEDEFLMMFFINGESYRYSLELEDGNVEHPIEHDNKNIKIEIGEFGTWSSYYGLRGALASSYKFKFNSGRKGDDNVFSMDTYCPVQAGAEFGVQYAGYTAIASPKRLQATSKNLLKKQEVIVGDCPPPIGDNSYGVDNTVSTNIIWKDLTSSINSIVDALGGSCGYNIESIKEVINEYKLKTARRKSVNKLTKEYSISGFPTRELTLDDGVSSFSVSVNPSNSAFSTSISFTNVPKIYVSEEIVYKELERNIIRRLSHNTRASSSNKINI